MISNQILQSTIDGLKSITRKELSVVEKEGKVIATTEENMIGRQIDAVENFISSPAESQLILGYQYFKIYDNGVPEYVIQVKGGGRIRLSDRQDCRIPDSEPSGCV